MCKANLTMYDSAGNETTNKDDSVKNVYHLMMDVQRTTPTTSNILVVKSGTASTIKAEVPTVVGLSSPPLSGDYRFKCTDSHGVVSYSDSIRWWKDPNTVNSIVMQSCTGLYDRMEITDTGVQHYKQNGVSFHVRFVGLNEDPGLFEIENVEGAVMGGNNLTFVSNTTIPYSKNLFYEPIPFEMLKTFESKPQLLVTVNDLPAVCHNLTCDYTYVEPAGAISSFTYDAASKLLSITGSAFPANITQIASVEFALTNCIINNATYSETNIDCTLVSDPTVGSWKPILVSSMGLIPNADSVNGNVIPSTVTSATPNTELNLLGGDEIVLAGTNLPRDLKRSTIEVKLSDTQETKCIPMTATGSELKCKTEKFAAASVGASFSVIVTINGQTVTNSLSMTMKDSIKNTLSLVPASASPVLKTKLTVTLESSFPHALNKADLFMWVTNKANSSIVKYVNVVSVDDSAKSFEAMFGGAESGVFDVHVKHS
jgi:hypothetical protein